MMRISNFGWILFSHFSPVQHFHILYIYIYICFFFNAILWLGISLIWPDFLWEAVDQGYCVWSCKAHPTPFPPWQVLEGRASGVFSDHTKGESPVSTTVGSGGLTPVAVKVLREDASPSEQQYFLQELRPYRDLSHPNVLRVLAHCLEAEPFLILLQLCPRVSCHTTQPDALTAPVFNVFFSFKLLHTVHKYCRCEFMNVQNSFPVQLFTVPFSCRGTSRLCWGVTGVWVR